MAPDRFVFIESQPASQSRRAKELKISQARAQAARFAYQQLKARHSSARRAASAEDSTQTETTASSNSNSALIPIRSEPPYYSASSDHQSASSLPVDEYAVPITLEEAEALSLSLGGPKFDDEQDEQQLESTAYTINERVLRPRTAWPTSTTAPHTDVDSIPSFPLFHTPSDGNSRVVDALQYLTFVVRPCFDISSYVFNVLNVTAFLPQAFMGECFPDAGIGAVLSLQDQLRSPGSRPSIEVLQRRGSAMAKVREKVALIRFGKESRPLDADTLFAMIFLGVLEGALRNQKARDLHKQIIGWIVAQAGGLQSLEDGTLLKCCLMLFDTFTAVGTGSTMFPGSPRRYKPIYPSHPISVELHSMIGSLPEGYQGLVAEGRLSCDVLLPLYRATYLTRITDAKTRSGVIESTRMQKKMYNDFWEACPCLTASPDDGDLMFEKLLALTLVGYCYTALGPKLSSIVLRESRAELTKKIVSYQARSLSEEECVIWMWIVAIDTWSIGQPHSLQPDGVSLVMELQTRFPQMRDLSAVKDLGNRFLWTKELETSVADYWDDLLSPG